MKHWHQVTDLLLAGLSDREIALKMNLHVGSIKTINSALYKHRAVKSRLAFVASVYREKIVFLNKEIQGLKQMLNQALPAGLPHANKEDA